MTKEILESPEAWVEGDPCPIKVAGIPCFGTVRLTEVIPGKWQKECSKDPYHHHSPDVPPPVVTVSITSNPQ